MIITFYHVVVFSAFVWPTVCYAALAATEKQLTERFGGDRTAIAAPVSNLITWLISVAVLCTAAHSRFALHTPSIEAEYIYVGMVLAQMCFHVKGRLDRDRVGIMFFVYACVVYMWSDNLVLSYATTFAFFRSVYATYPAMVELGVDVLETRGLGVGFMKLLRVTETVVLTAMCLREIWISGTIDGPVMLCLDVLTVWGSNIQSFIQRRDKRESVKM